MKSYRTSPASAREYLTAYSTEQAALVVDRWRRLGEYLIVKCLDGNVHNDVGEITEPGYPEHWQRRMAQDCGDHCKLGGN